MPFQTLGVVSGWLHQLGMSLVEAIGLSLVVGTESKYHRIPLEPELGPLA